MINLYWWHDAPNAGDRFGYWLASKIYKDTTVKYSTNPKLVIAGSILDRPELSNRTIVWGAGLHNCEKNEKCRITNKDNFKAVRGKLTAEKLGLDSVVLGDPGLLASKFYKLKEVPEKKKYCLICHKDDYAEMNALYSSSLDVYDMGTNDVERIFDIYANYEIIFSSSLHGIIFAHSFGLPAVHIEYNMLASKKNFKFADYYSVIDTNYAKYKLTKNAAFDLPMFDKFYNNRDQYKMSNERLVDIQNNLLEVVPSFEEVNIEPIVNAYNPATKCIGLISWLPDDPKVRQQRKDRLNRLFKQLESLWPDVDFLIITQNWKRFKPVDTSNTQIRVDFDEGLGILKARQVLREEFIKYDYNHLIMFDDDAIVDYIEDDLPIRYMQELDAHPNGFCFIHGKDNGNKFHPYAAAQLNLCAISKYIYEREPMVPVDPQKNQGYEDSLFATLLHHKWAAYEFLAPEGIKCTQFQNAIEKVPSTWWGKNGCNGSLLYTNHNKIAQYIVDNKELPDLNEFFKYGILVPKNAPRQYIETMRTYERRRQQNKNSCYLYF